MSSIGPGASVLLLLEVRRGRRFLLFGSSCGVSEYRSDFRADATEMLLLEEASDCAWRFLRRRCSARFSERDVDLADSRSEVSATSDLLLEVTNKRRLLLGSSCGAVELPSDFGPEATMLSLVGDIFVSEEGFFERFLGRVVELFGSSSEG